jgi:hypothetical protein
MLWQYIFQGLTIVITRIFHSNKTRHSSIEAHVQWHDNAMTRFLAKPHASDMIGLPNAARESYV